MAKKIIIQGSDLLHTLSDPWSGVNTESESIDVYGTSVPPRAEWGVNLDEIERFLKAEFKDRVGYTKVVTAPDNITNRIAGFANSDDYDAWNQLSSTDKWGEAGRAYLVTWDNLPSLDIGDTYYVDVQIDSYHTNQPNTDVNINIKGRSYVRHASGTEEDIQESLTILVQTKTSANANWRDQESFTIVSNRESWTSISFAPYLVSGANYIRLKAIGEYAEGLVWRNMEINVINLSLVNNTPTYIPVEGNALNLNFLIGGNIQNKYLRLQFGTGLEEFTPQWDYTNCPACNIPIAGTNTSTGMSFEFAEQLDLLTDILDDGVHTVKAQLYVSDYLQTEWITFQYMVDSNPASIPVVVVNNKNATLDNYTNVTFFDWAVSKDTAVVFRLTDENNQETYGSWQQNAEMGIQYTLQTQLGIESNAYTLYGFMHIEDSDGHELHDPVFFTINNNSDYAPVSGPTFVLQPSTRSNSEETPGTIINAATGEVVPSDGWNTLGMGIADGYIDGALVVNAGSQLRIGANFLKTLANPSGSASGLIGKSVTAKMTIKVSNIIDDTLPVIKLGSYFNTANDHDIWGIEIRPTEAALLTQNSRTRDDQNITWAEDRRTTLTFNIVYGLNPDNDPNGTRLNYVRLFVNDTIEKEFEYKVNDRFINSENAELIIGSNGANIAIYDMRFYEKALSTDDVMKDYRAGLSTNAEKRTWLDRNNILGDNETIDINKAINAGYNVLGHTGHLPKYGDENKGKTKGVSLMIHINGDPSHSGVLTNLEGSGQGTTAMTYYDWNQQYKIGDSTVFTSEDGTTTEPGTGYAIQAGEALAKKLVGKINFASSMQGHKMGITRVYDEVFKELVREGNMSRPYQISQQSSARLTVLERPFLFFHRETAEDPWTFCYLMTFGAGKGDKPTFGFNKNTTPHMLMVEGADNDRTLALFNAPWNSEVTYDAGAEAWCINSQKHINFGYGKTSVVGDEEVPSDAVALNGLKGFWNFVYLHVRNISYYTGTLAQLKNSEPYAEGANVPSTGTQYWMTRDTEQDFARYDLFRYDVAINDWVKAGIEPTDTLNIRTQYEEMCTELGRTADAWTDGQWLAINNKVKTLRTSHFREYASNYMFVDDALYHDAIIKLFAGTDNRSKNTYYYTDWDSSTESIKIRWQQDDVDTTLKTNNVGQQRKPYYVEEHDQNAAGEYYWQAENSGLYNLIEEAFADELKVMMRRILTAMASLGGSAFDYLVSRVLEAQNYFPAVAYNEQARLVYERASIAQEDGTYVNAAVKAITQSNGTQLWSEYQWLADRVMYISSWCEYGDFASGTGSSGTLTFRGQSGQYNFALTPAKWLYPRIGQGSSNVAPANNSAHVRVQAGEVFHYKPINNEGDTSISIRGINYYSEIGDMNVPVSPTMQTSFPFSGARLKKITVNPEGNDENLFRTSEITVSSINITEFTVRNVDSLRNVLDLSRCLLLKKIDLRGSTPIRVILPESSTLAEIHLPASLTELNIRNLPNVEVFDIQGYSYIERVDITNCSIDSINILQNIFELYDQGEPIKLNYFNVENIDITLNNNVEFLLFLADIKTHAITNGSEITGESSITGRIHLSFPANTYLTYDQKEKLMQAFGDIDSEDNQLYVTYDYSINPALRVSIFCDGVADIISNTGNYQFMAIPTTVASDFDDSASYIRKIEWSLAPNSYATIDENGLMTVTSIGSDITMPTITLYLTVTLINGDVVRNQQGVDYTDSLTLNMWPREADLGDYVYADGSYSKTWYNIKTCVGIVFLNEKGLKEICALSEFRHVWGLLNDSSNGVTGVTLDGQTAAYDTPLSNLSQTQVFNITDTNANYFNNANDEFVSSPNTNAEGELLFTPSVDTVIDALVGGSVLFEAGKTYPAGYRNTLVLMRWRNIILSYAEKVIPAASGNETEKQCLDRLISAIVSESGSANYRQYYYPAASYCHAYEPTVKSYETLHDKFKAHRWWLPSSGELARIFFYWLRNDSTGNSRYDAFKAAKAAGRISFTADATPNNDWYWSSTERDNAKAWEIRNGSILGDWYNVWGRKDQSYRVRPVCLL